VEKARATGEGCESVAMERIAKLRHPTYVYSRRAIEESLGELNSGRESSSLLCFAVKANGNLCILKLLARRGCGFDIVSGGELEHLRRIGVNCTVSFSGVGKTREEIREGCIIKSI
jgi:diaminopimelate decarboxylase